ncbi:MAG TPA: hypothetical protein VJP39_01440 [Gaiellaceae bacterium]|nr:hypothetical protein [Gaiellaceae bacterium]
MRRITYLVVLAIAAVAASAAFASSTTVSVPATSAPVRGFTGETPPVDSGITLTSSLRITVTAGGMWSAGGGVTTSANGTSATCGSVGGGCPVDSAGRGALIGSLNGGASWFFIGAGPVVMQGTGTLLLAMNDTWNGDNSGALSVNITSVSMPTNAAQCKNGAWLTYGFKNQGDCTNYVNNK